MLEREGVVTVFKLMLTLGFALSVGFLFSLLAMPFGFAMSFGFASLWALPAVVKDVLREN
jgi:hypothetical protein